MNKRRKFLGLLTSAVVLPHLPVSATSRLSGLSAPPARTDISVGLLLELIPDNPAARRLGRAAIDQLGSDRFPEDAATRLVKDMRGNASLTLEQLRDHLETLRQTDFENGSTVTVNGWILARSEADALAIATFYRAS
jgi:hypothetical protein